MLLFEPRLDVLPAAQRRLPEALAAAQAIYGSSFNPQITLKALSYYGDGDLATLPVGVRDRLQDAARTVDLDALPPKAAR